MSETFHRRGHHVQKAHGRRTHFATDGSHLSGGMIALMPTAADAVRLALPGGEAAADLHCTLLFLGDDGAAWPPEARDALEAAARSVCADLTPVPGNVFGVAHWNGGGDNPSWVWNVGDDPDAGLAESTLHESHCAVGDIIGMAQAALDGDLPEIPRQHSPWAAHICAAYTDDLTLVRALEKRLGPVTFDRIRLSFGDDDRDIPLTARAVGLTASGLRRETHAHEAHTDFAEHNRQWDTAVAAASARLTTVLSGWRADIRAQLAADPTSEELARLALDPAPAVDILDEAMTDLAQRAGRALQREAEAQGVEVPEWSLPEDAVTAAVGGRRLLRSVADMTAGLMAGSLVQSAKRLALGLLTRQADPSTIASEVDTALQEGQDAVLSGPVATAMSTAQTAGRQAVLEAAPPGEYYASEMLDRNTCAPCKAVDGEQFGSLEIAVKAYPVMGYKDCVGPRYGHPCRGMIVARWTPEPDSGPVTAAGEVQPFHGSLGDPGYHQLHPGNVGKGLSQNGRGTWMGSPDYTAEEQQASLEYYTQEGSLEMNAYLRDGSLPRGGTEEDAKHNTRVLNDLIDIQDPLTEPVTVYRGGPDLGLSPGDEITDRGFLSNSDEESIADAFALGYLIRDGVQGQTYTVTIPAGARVLPVWGVDPSIDNESEWILPPGTRMRAVSPTELEVIVD